MTDTNALTATLQKARDAQNVWAAKAFSERLLPIARLRARLAAEPFPLAEVVAAEIGKTRYEALGAEVLPTAEICSFLLDRAARVLAPRYENLRGTMPFTGRAEIRRIPWGVVAAIVPWNYPLFLCAGSTLSALVAGNAVVMKASPRAAKTVAAFGEWLYAAGVPRELAPVLDSSDEMGKALVASPLINRIVFTGSSRTGRSILHAAAENLTPATVELSGFDAVFVAADADVALAAAAVSFGLRLNAGRTCICPRRVFLEQPVAAEFTSLLSKRLTSRKLLSPMDPQTLKEADELAAKLEATGARNLTGRQLGDKEKALVYAGGREALAAAQGNFVPAVVLAEVPSIDAALELDAASPYGLGASVFTEDPQTLEKIVGYLRSGLIAVNECVAPGGEAALPFGGGGESGYGVRSGEDGLLEMTRPQVRAFARGRFRPHHDVGEEAEKLVVALLRARHSASLWGRMMGWLDYLNEAVKLQPAKLPDE